MTHDLLATRAPPPPIAPIATRAELIDELGKAAELEHAIMCQYLYAAFSLDRTAPGLSPSDQETVRTFATQTLLIARQEMEHLGIVSNLLIAVGAPPNLDRPNLPLQPNYYQIDLPLALLPFGDDFLALAEQLEMPDTAPTRAPMPTYPSVAAIYDRLRAGVIRLATELPDLFLGADCPQLSNADFGAGPHQVWYNVAILGVTDLPSAVAAIDLIRVQGEGSTAEDEHSHFERVREMRETWRGLDDATRARMLRRTPANPLTGERGDVDPDATTCLLTDPRAVALARLENRVYELLLLLLARLYGDTDATDADRTMYRDVAFFPLMTMVVRPVSEILVQLPAGDGKHAAAPTFELDGPIRTYLDRHAFHVQLGERLGDLARGFAAIADQADVAPRLHYVAKNVAYVRDRVNAYVAGDAPP